jgi:hypothetical protein
MDYSEYILGITLLTRMMHEACQKKEYENAYKIANEIEAQALAMKKCIKGKK